MIIVYTPSVTGAGLDRASLDHGVPIPENALWIDLLEPTRTEDHLVEAFLKVSIPTREEMKDLEPSEIIYAEDAMPVRHRSTPSGSDQLHSDGAVTRDGAL